MYTKHYPYLQMPPQPDNPSNVERRELGRYALWEKGRPEDFEIITRLLSPPPDITDIAKPGEFKDIKIGIIGGGLAGLSSAFELRKLGFDITVFEAQEDHIGGRVYTYYFNKEKTLYGELGPMRIPVTHETVWHYINLFKLSTRPFIQVNKNAFIYLQDIRVRNDPMGYNVMKYIYPTYDLTPAEKVTPWQQLVFYGLDSPLLKSTAAIRSEILKVLPEYHPQVQFWDIAGIRQLLELENLSNSAINLISSLAPLAGEFLYNNYIDFVQENYPADFTFLYEIKGGFTNLPMAFYNSLTSTSPEGYPNIPTSYLGSFTFKNGNWVTGIYRQKDSGKVILEYRSKNADKDSYQAFDYVICTIPFSTLRAVRIDPLFSDIKMQAIKEVTYVSAQKTAFLCKYRFWESGDTDTQILGGGSYTDLPITMIWYPSDHAKYSKMQQESVQYPSQLIPTGRHVQKDFPYWKEPGVLISSYNFNLNAVRLGNMTDETRFMEIKREVEEVHGLSPGFLNNIVTDFKTEHWNANPWTRGAFCFFTSQQKKIFSYPMSVPEYDGKVFFAGEHISPTHRWMQGALKTGMEAANSLAATCKMYRSRI